jgi:putative copper export protein
LAPLALVARDGKPAQLAAVAARFGRTALGLVAVLVAAGASLLWMVILRSTDFLGSLYGRLMLAKLLAVALLLSLAAVNKLLLTPAMCANHAKARSRFRRSLQAEMILGGVILIITAAFTTLAGPP